VSRTNGHDPSRLLFYTALILFGAGMVLGYGLYSGVKENWLYRAVDTVRSDFALLIQEKDNLAKIRPLYFLQPARHEGAGVTVNDAANDQDDLILLAGFFEDNNELRLIRRNGETVNRWPAKFSALFPDTSRLANKPATDWNVDIHGALAEPDGSVVFNFEYTALVKLDRCGAVLWSLPLPTHHSVERAEGGGYWVPGRRSYEAGETSPFPPFGTPLQEDTILKVSADGAVLAEVSIPGLFYANDLETLLTANGEWITPKIPNENEIVHANKITELTRDLAGDFPQFEAGDLLLSLREYNMLLIANPDTRRIKWWKIGPWARQHDPEFVPGGKIVVFNNNIYRAAFGMGPDISRRDIPRVSNIIEYDFRSGSHRVLFGGVPGQEFLSVIRGKVEYLPTGNLLITESEGGTVIEADANGRIVWEYVNRYDGNSVAELNEARVYPADYFAVKDWSCGAGDGQAGG
jgi:hypothetical protein